MTDASARPDSGAPLLVSGSVAFDLIMDFPGLFKDHILPDKLHVINISFLVEKLSKQNGGCGGNIAYTLALLGERPRLVAAVGDDFAPYGAVLSALGVDLSAVRTFEDEMSASGFATTDRDNSQIWGFYPGAMRRAAEISIAEVAAEGARGLMVAPDDPAAMSRHCREARQVGLPFFFDPSFQVTNMEGPDLAEATRGALGLFLNDYEHSVFQEKTGFAGDRLFELSELVVVTLGEKGSRVETRDGAIHEIPPVPLDEAVDPTGAGDAYRGGFLAGWTKGFELPVCGRMGSLAAAWAVEHYGTQSHRYERSDFTARYEAAFGEPLVL